MLVSELRGDGAGAARSTCPRNLSDIGFKKKKQASVWTGNRCRSVHLKKQPGFLETTLCFAEETLSKACVDLLCSWTALCTLCVYQVAFLFQTKRWRDCLNNLWYSIRWSYESVSRIRGVFHSLKPKCHIEKRYHNNRSDQRGAICSVDVPDWKKRKNKRDGSAFSGFIPRVSHVIRHVCI